MQYPVIHAPLPPLLFLAVEISSSCTLHPQFLFRRPSSSPLSALFPPRTARTQRTYAAHEVRARGGVEGGSGGHPKQSKVEAGGGERNAKRAGRGKKQEGTVHKKSWAVRSIDRSIPFHQPPTLSPSAGCAARRAPLLRHRAGEAASAPALSAAAAGERLRIPPVIPSPTLLFSLYSILSREYGRYWWLENSLVFFLVEDFVPFSC